MIPDDLKTAVDSLALAEIVLASIRGDVKETAAIGVDFPPFRLETMRPHPVSVQSFDADGEGELPRRIQVRVKAGARLIPKGETAPEKGHTEGQKAETEFLASVETEFLVTYAERLGAHLSDEALQLFADHNVPFNVWPYWREVVHATFSRMGLPRVVIPLYRMRKVKDESVRVGDEGNVAEEPKPATQ